MRRCSATYGLISVIILAGASSAQQAKLPPSAPIPAQIASARKAFISNAGGASFENVIDETVFDGGPDRPYDEFYAAMKEWGKYEIVSSPADADLVFAVSWELTDTGLRLPVLGELHVVAIDPKTNITLWTVTQYVRGAMLLSNRDKNFDQAMTIIANRLKILASPAPAMADTSNK
jgi:hypothetical protein